MKSLGKATVHTYQDGVRKEVTGTLVSLVDHHENEDEFVALRLVPVEVFGAEDGYGLADAVSAWSDCNRAIGHIYRVDDIEGRPGKTVEILVRKSDLSFFQTNWSANDTDEKELN